MVEIQHNIALKNYCTFGIGGPAANFAAVKTIDELVQAIQFAKDNALPILIFGGGSNLLFPDQGIQDKLIIRNQINGISLDESDCTLEIGSGLMWPHITRFCRENNLFGLESFSGLPGTIGGAVYGNAGCHGTEMKDVLKKIQVIDTETAQLKEIAPDSLEFAYRESILKRDKNLIVTKVVLKVSKDPNQARGDAKAFADHRKTTQPTGLTTGSFFKNPPKNFAGKLIEECGLKGHKIGGIQLSTVHGNFFMNDGTGTASDVIKLKDLVIATVKDKKEIELEPEVQIIQ